MRLKESINQNQINLLKATYGDIKKINPNSPAVKKLMMALKKLSKDDLETLSKAKINFVSTMAQSILRDSNVSESAEMDNLQKRKNDLLKQVDPLIAKKKKLYSDVDITTPKSSDEKKLDKEIADLFSEINDLVHKIVKLKKSQNEGRNTMKLKSVNEAGYTVKAENPYQFVNGAYAVLSAYLKDEELGPKGKRELQDIIKSLDYMRKYFYFKMSESVNEAASVSHVRSTIEKVKKQLIQKWKQKGGYENFGEKEGRMLSDKFNTNPYGSSDERRIHSMIQDFENWAMNYDGKSESVNEEITVGKMVKVVDNPHWEAALGKKGPFKRKVKMIDGDNVFFTDGSNSSMKYVKESAESINDADVNWNAVQNALINFLKMNTKILDKKVQAKDTEGVKGGLKSIISGLTNAQRSLKLESAKKSTFIKVARISNNGKLDIY